MSYIVGVDIGGTFTDCVVVNDQGEDRLVKELRLRGIDDIQSANAFLPEFIADYNQRGKIAFHAAGLLRGRRRRGPGRGP